MNRQLVLFRKGFIIVQDKKSDPELSQRLAAFLAHHPDIIKVMKMRMMTMMMTMMVMMMVTKMRMMVMMTYMV